MKKKQIVSLVLALILICSLSSAYAAGAAGGASDPLVSKSYIDNIYPPLVLGQATELLKNSMLVLEYKLSQKTAGLTYLAVSAGAEIAVSSGGSFVFLSGAVKLTSLSGVLIDVTDGKTISSGDSLTVRHRYVAGANTGAKITAASASRITAMGSVAIMDSSMTFADVNANAWFYDYVLYAFRNSLINGKSESTFAPDENLKINEAIKLAACMHQLFNTGGVTLTNGETTWYSTYLEYAAHNGIISKTYTNYDAYITRDEFVNIFYSALPETQYTPKNTVADNAIPDVKSTGSYAYQIYTFYRAGILNGKDAYGSFWPGENILRSEVAAIMTRMFENDQRVAVQLT